jgi:hypothetical protein
MLANIELDSIDPECQRVPESIEAIFQALTGSTAMPDNVAGIIGSGHGRTPGASDGRHQTIPGFSRCAYGRMPNSVLRRIIRD